MSYIYHKYDYCTFHFHGVPNGGRTNLKGIASHTCSPIKMQPFVLCPSTASDNPKSVTPVQVNMGDAQKGMGSVTERMSVPQ